MRPLRQEIKYRRWKFIIHILRKDYNNDCNISWTPKGRKKRGRPKTTWRKTVGRRERKVDKGPGLRRGLLLRIKMDGDVLLMVYVPQGTKWIGNR